MKRLKLTSSLIVICLMTLTASAKTGTRQWTDASTNRTIEGTFIKVDGDEVVIKLANGKSVNVIIKRLSAADQKFITEQSAELVEPAEKAAGQLIKIIPPISVKALPVKGEGDNRKAGLEITNNSEKSISKLILKVFLYDKDSKLKKDFPSSNDGQFKEHGKSLAKGKSYISEVSKFWIKDHITSVSGSVSELTWEDGSTWPTWEKPAPKQEGDIPASLVMQGVLGQGDTALPIIGCYNHSDKVIKSVRFTILFLDDAGKKLDRGDWGYGHKIIQAGKGNAYMGYKATPKGTNKVTLTLTKLIYEDDSEWESEAKK